MAIRNTFDTEKRTCDRCGFDHKKSSLRKQKGLWLGHDCFDNIDKIQEPRVRWQQTRSDSDTVTIPAESTPEVFTVTSGGGVTLISQSNKEVDFRDGRHQSFYMKVVSDGGAITISANPQITGGQILGDILTLRGTSDTDTIEIVDARGVRTFGGSGLTQGKPVILDSKTTVSFVYTNVFIGWGSMQWGSDPWGDGSGGADFIPIWVETSRFDGGL
jgi:hypothetical protein